MYLHNGVAFWFFEKNTKVTNCPELHFCESE